MLKISRRDHRQIADRINRCAVWRGEQMDFNTIIASNSIGEGGGFQPFFGKLADIHQGREGIKGL